jgi:1,4-alpha-glucan branching enzyme
MKSRLSHSHQMTYGAATPTAVIECRKESHELAPLMEQTVQFRFFSPNANDVDIVGDFTGWRCGQIHMTKGDGGFWTAELPLAEGIFHFRYLADGEWHTDETACSVDDGPFGIDSVLWVLPQSLTPTQQRQARKRMLRMADARIGSPGAPLKRLSLAKGDIDDNVRAKADRMRE